MAAVTRNRLGLLLLCLVCGLAACVPKPPPDLFKLDQAVVALRSLQTREFDTKDEAKILNASLGVLQDLNFTVDESEPKLGIVMGSKEAEVNNSGQIAGAIALSVLGALVGVNHDPNQDIEAVERFRAAVVSTQTSKGTIQVRVIFQRLSWNRYNQLMKLQTLDQPDLYEGFFERLSKAVFLEAQGI